MKNASGGVLYAGKAASLNKRVTSYFRRGAGIYNRIKMMLDQARRTEDHTSENQ